MSELLAVIFDLDGVIVSTDDYHYRGWQRLADEIGVPFDRRRNERLRGVDRMNSLRRLLPENHGYSEAELHALATRKNEYYKELIKQVSPRDILPGVPALLDDLDAHQVRKAIASASKNAPEVLERLGIGSRFEVIVTGHDFTHGKPAPDIFLTAARRLKLPPANCLVVEDAVSGVEAGVAAGMKVLGRGSDPDLLKAGAARMVESLAEVTCADLARLAACRT